MILRGITQLSYLTDIEWGIKWEDMCSISIGITV